MLKEIGGYNEQLRYAQDHDLWWRLGAKGQLAVLPELLVKWRDCANISQQHQMEQRRDVCSSCWEYVKSRLESATEQEEAAFRRFWHSFRHREGSMQKGDIKRLASVWKLLQPIQEGAQTHGADYWMWRFIHFVKHLLCRGKFGEAAAMLRFLRQEAGLSRWVAFGRLAVVFAPPLGLGLGKRLWGVKR